MKQRTLARAVSVQGNGLHTGEPVTLTLKPAPAGSGIVFRRTDLHGSPELRARVDQVTDLVRATTIQSGHAKIHTVEHVLSALQGCGVDNVVIEMDGSEPPILDGSARPFVALIDQGGPAEQEAEREYFRLDAPVSVTRGNSSIIALPSEELKISCTSADDRGVHTQHLTVTVDPESYRAQIAAARTFTIYEDIEELLKLGKIRGGSLDSAVVIRGDKIISKEPLRFKDEFVRHKILDLVGDVTLLGLPLKAHLVAVRPGHAINAELTRALYERLQAARKGGRRKAGGSGPAIAPGEATLDIRRILETIPHRYPFLMVDRVVEFKADGREIVALKNVTINEPYFNGHFPGDPVMPGVLQLEAMAQAAGIMMLRLTGNESGAELSAFLMSADKVKFRRPVRPGDQLVITARMLKARAGRLAVAAAECTVDGQLASSAELMFTVMPEGGE
jgi:UDP-3-O-[3-hydroxymyristoyl] N-acetylglucosamine deacetylase / 3-hydroxyacyl-[acyl-carrier-protein] dehydratase